MRLKEKGKEEKGKESKGERNLRLFILLAEIKLGGRGMSE